jgi:hypothetical protein
MAVWVHTLAIVPLSAQDSLLRKNLQAHKYDFAATGDHRFAGAGWDSLVQEGQKAQYFLIGEIHGINEIPYLVNALAQQISFETFVIEIDPYLNTILQAKIKTLNEQDLQKWYQEFGSNLSFYSYQQDFELLKHLHRKGTTIMGIDQITALNDVPVYAHLAAISPDKKRKQQYLQMGNTAREVYSGFLKDPKKAPYMLGPQFQEAMDQLPSKGLSKEEKEIIEKLQYSRGIYTARDGHARRIRLMKQQLRQQYEAKLASRKTLFRLGANHSLKGESYLTIYDVGNFVHNLAESQLQSSFHVGVFATSGEAGNPIKGKPHTTVEPMKELALFHQLASPDKWTYFDLRPLKKLLDTGKVKVEDTMMRRTIQGYDGLVIIPKATAGEHSF